MIWALIPLLVFAAFCLLFPVISEDPIKRPKCYLASEVDAAIHGAFHEIEMRKVETLRHTRESARRHYEGITWPAIQWEIRKRELARYMPTMRAAS